jgi:hypothetical protein
MASKRKTRRTRRTRKTIKIKRTRRHTRRRVMRGGNFKRDYTSRTIDGIPTKAANKVVVTVPGRGTMSGVAFIRLQEDLDRNGDDLYD